MGIARDSDRDARSKIAKIAIFVILMRASRFELQARTPFAICIHVPSLKFQLNVGPDLCSSVRGGGLAALSGRDKNPDYKPSVEPIKGFYLGDQGLRWGLG